MSYLRGKRWRWARWIGVFLIISGFAIIAFRYQITSVIKPYNDQQDRPLVQDSFKKDKFWLTDNPNFDIDRMLNDRNPSQYLTNHTGKLQIKVLFDKNKKAGFTAYYKKNFYEGRVLFLWVDPSFRGHGYGKTLLDHAINQLFKEGCTKVTLVTRVINTWAQKVYKEVGMTETHRDKVFVYFAITKK
ncbi:GNAT family N-acetyltransferase [bacterium]|jgi:ribosomal protein S18 acetylase RimI-like enzyme|nr:GNAT family N-acetyltransferase [bacterium]MBT5015664.1 GNAT family N-acetyltransferase [bacterium]